MRPGGDRRWVAVVLGAVLLAACSSDPASSPSSSATSGPAGAPAAPSTANPSTAGTVPTSRPTTTLARGTVPAVVPPSRTRPAPPVPDPEPVTEPGPPGAAAVRFLRGADTLRLEVLVQAGAEPRAATVDHVAAVLRRSSARPVAVVRGAVPGTRDRWSDDEVRAAAGRPPSPVVRLLFLRGASTAGTDVLGVAVQENAAAVFVDRVRAASTPLVNAATLEAAVTTHELGHLLGLVDLVLRTGRADRDHPGHSTNRSSVMFWAVESDLVGSVLTGGPPTDFDDADRADLRAMREG